MMDYRSAKGIIEQARERFGEHKFIIVFSDPRKYPKETDIIREYFIKANSDSFLMAGYIGDFTNDDLDDDRWKKFSDIQYDRLCEILSVEEDKDCPISIVVFEKNETARISCCKDPEQIWMTVMLAYRNRIGRKGPYYLVERQGSVIDDVIVSPWLLREMLGATILMAALLMFLLTIRPYVGYVLFTAVFIASAWIALRMSKNPDGHILKNIPYSTAGNLMSMAMPGTGCIIKNRKRGLVILSAYYLFFLVTFISLAEFADDIPPKWRVLAVLWILFSALLFEYIALCDTMYPILEKKRFIYSNTLTDMIVKLHFLPMVAYAIMVFLTFRLIGTDGVIPVIAYTVPTAYFIISWIRHPMKHAYLEDRMNMDMTKIERPKSKKKRRD